MGHSRVDAPFAIRMMLPMLRSSTALVPARARSRCRSRRLAFALALGFGLPAATASAPAQAEERKTLGADVKIEIKQPAGKVVTHRTQQGSIVKDTEDTIEGAGA